MDLPLPNSATFLASPTVSSMARASKEGFALDLLNFIYKRRRYISEVIHFHSS